MQYIPYDLIVALLLLLSLWQGYRKGFVLTLCGLLALFVAFIGATLISDTLAQPVANSIQPIVERHIQDLIQEQQIPADLSDLLTDEILDDVQIPLEDVLAPLRDSSLFQGFADAFQNAVESGAVAVAGDAAKAIAGYVALQLAETVLFLVAFITILVLWSLLSHVLDLAFRLPVLSTLNHWAGAVLGLLKGFVLVYIAVQLLENGFLSPDVIEDTYLLRFFSRFHPMMLFAAISQ